MIELVELYIRGNNFLSQLVEPEIYLASRI